jgi:hypothetical protein
MTCSSELATAIGGASLGVRGETQTDDVFDDRMTRGVARRRIMPA